jgi:cytochrome P450
MVTKPQVLELRDVDPFAPEHRADPYPLYERLRADAPIWYHPQYDELVLTGHADCEAVLRDPRWSSDPENIDPSRRDPDDMRLALGDLKSGNLLFLDPPDHTRLRRLVSKAFTPRTIEQLRPHVHELVDDMLDELRDAGEIDLMTGIAYPLPVTVICELMGVPLQDRHLFAGWSSDASRLLDGEVEGEVVERGIVAAMSFISYFNDLFDERRKVPRNDLLSALLAAEDEGDRLSEAELRSIVLLLFVAGHETTMNLIGNGMWALLAHPDQQRRLQDDPSLVPNAVEEMLRYDGPVHITGRIAREDLEVGGLRVDQGRQVSTLLAAANRDPERFSEPARFDVEREDVHHLTFSGGIHYCLGAALARLEGQVVVGSLVQRFPGLELRTEYPEHREHFVLRGLKQLRVGVG